MRFDRMRSSASDVIAAWSLALLLGGGYFHLQASSAPPTQTRSRAAQPPAAAPRQTGAAAAGQPEKSANRAFLDKYCVTCHNQRLKTAGLMLDTLEVDEVAAAPEIWEKVISKTRGGLMPPAGRPRPDSQAFTA